VRVLFAVAHFYSRDTQGGGKPGHASVGGPEAKRVAALTACIGSVLQHFGGQYVIDIYRRRLEPAGTGGAADVVVCTTRGRHVLDLLPLPPDSFTRLETDADPPYLGFECHKALAERLGEYDYYCYLEDDLVLHDPLFFDKLSWFNGQAGDDCALQPNRFERSLGRYRKVYIDGDIRPGATEAFQNVREHPVLKGRIMGRETSFFRPHNPHSGCFFLNAGQMRVLSERPYFAKPEKDFISPLESAATLHLMRTFRVYKPTPENASFLEIEHHQPNFISLIGRQVSPPSP
jgi:hypothetical protein